VSDDDRVDAPDDTHWRFLHRAARLALRGHGGAEPNPLVGCVIVNDAGQTVGWGYHRQVGGPHAEIVALRRAGGAARGSTMYCTLEPCNHHGRTGPCTQAIIEAGIARVLVARRDPWPVAAGGIETLRAAGLDARVLALGDRPARSEDDPAHSQFAALAHYVAEPFVHRIASGLPWVTVKWAQTRDGYLAMPPSSAERWISCEASRRMVHRERGRVDAILTGIGTALADDPLLTPRGVRLRRAHRLLRGMPWRIVVDPDLRLPMNSQLVATSQEAPLMIACSSERLRSDEANRLRQRSVTLLGFASQGRELPLADLLKRLTSEFDFTHVLVEAGPGVMRRLIAQRLANEAWVFTSATLLGREALVGLPHVRDVLGEARLGKPWSIRRRERDVIERFML